MPLNLSLICNYYIFFYFFLSNVLAILSHNLLFFLFKKLFVLFNLLIPPFSPCLFGSSVVLFQQRKIGTKFSLEIHTQILSVFTG